MPLYTFTPRRDNVWIWLPILGALAAFPLLVTSEYILNDGVLAGIYVILTMGLNITNGWTGLMSFGYAAFYGIVAYTAAILTTRYGMPFWITFAAGGLMAGLFGVAIALPTLRLKGIFLALVTIGFQEIIFLVTLNWTSLTRGPMVIQILYFRVTGGKRFFKMAPIHLHFELLGWSETQIVQRFWLIGLLAGMIGMGLALV